MHNATRRIDLSVVGRDTRARKASCYAPVMSYLYGDSTPFPYDIDYIELSRHAVDCAMQLHSAQHAIASALSREEGQNQQGHRELTRLGVVSEAIETAVAPFLDAEEATARAALAALQSAKASLEEARADG